MSIRHTKSTSGLTHRLDVHGTMVTIRFREIAHNDHVHDEQVEGDLVRKYWREGGTVKPIGPVGCRIDPDLDAEEIERRRLTPEDVAEAAIKAAPWRADRTAIMEWQVQILIASAIKADRAQR